MGAASPRTPRCFQVLDFTFQRNGFNDDVWSIFQFLTFNLYSYDRYLKKYYYLCSHLREVPVALCVQTISCGCESMTAATFSICQS